MRNNRTNVDRMFGSYLSASILTVAAVQVANIVDASLVGNIIGENGLAAVNVCRPALQAMFSLSIFFVTGGTMLAGMAIGRKDRKGADRLFSLSIMMTVAVAVLISLAGTIFLGPLVRLLCKSDTVLPLARDFLRVMLLSAVPMMLMTAVDFFVTVDGEPKRASFAVITSNVVNLVLDIVFMKYLGMGIAGAALATCIMYITCILLVLPHFRKDDTLRLTKDVSRNDITPILAYGLPLFISSILLSVQFACNNIVCSRYFGDSGLVAYAVCMQLLMFSSIFLNGTYRTVQPVGAILKGQDDTAGIRRLIQKAYRFLFVCLAIFSALTIIFPRQISTLLGVGEADNISVALSAIPAFTLQIVIQTLLGNLVPVYQIYSRNRLALFLSIVQAILPFFGFWLFSELSLNLHGLNPWLGFAAGQLASVILLMIPLCIIRIRNPKLTPLFLVPYDAGKRGRTISIAESLTGRMAVIMLFFAVIIMSVSYRMVSQNVIESNQRYAKMVLSVYGDVLYYETEREKVPIDINCQEAASEIGDYFCRWYNVDYLYMYVPDIEKGTAEILSFSIDEKYSEEYDSFRGDTIPGSVVGYSLTDDEIALWNGEVMFAVSDAKLFKSNEEIEYLFKDAFGNKVIIGGAVSDEEIRDQIRHRLITVALVIVVLIVLTIVIFHLLISRKASLPAKNISKVLYDYVQGSKRSKVRLDEVGFSEFAMISESFNRMSDDIDRYLADIEKLNREQERQNAEIDIAASIQKGLLPAREALTGNSRIHSGMKPAKYIGGDLYDYYRIDDNHTMAVVADVSGKGLSASMFMAVTLTLIHQAAKLGNNPAAILNNVNSTLSEENPNMMFVTAFIAIYDSSNHTVTYANAGHNFPYIISDRLTLLDGKPGAPLGLFQDERYAEVSVPMNVGDTLFLYTDGVNEAVNEKGEFFGTDRLEKVLMSLPADSNAALCVYDAMLEFVGNAEQNDDITMLAMTAYENAPLELDYDIREFEKIKSLIMESGMPDSVRLDLCVAAEECFVNICSYAFDGNVPEGEKILFSIEYSSTAVLRFVDGGKRFDPRKNLPQPEEYDIDTNVGGLGRLIAFTVADSVDYEYTDGKNILTIVKTLKKR